MKPEELRVGMRIEVPPGADACRVRGYSARVEKVGKMTGAGLDVVLTKLDGEGRPQTRTTEYVAARTLGTRQTPVTIKACLHTYLVRELRT